jgi:MFS family permease
MKNNRLLLLGAAHSLNHSLFVVAPPLLTLIMSNLGTSKLSISTVATVASFVYGFGALAGGPLGDRIGEAKTIALSLALSGLSALIMLVAGALQSIYAFAVVLILMAVWASFYHPTANSLISKGFRGRVAESMGLHGVGGTLGVVLTPTVAFFLGAVLGWQYAFVFFGILCMILALPFAKGLKGAEHAGDKFGSIVDAFKIRKLRVLLAFNIAIGLFMKGIELFLPTFLQEAKMVDPLWASIAYTLVLAAGVPGQWIGGKSADRIGSKRVLTATMVGISFGLLLLLFVPNYAVGIALFIPLYGLCFYAHQPALNSLTAFLSPRDQRGAVFGIFFFTSFGIGSLSQVMAGYIADAFGLTASFYLLAAFALFALGLSIGIPDTRED